MGDNWLGVVVLLFGNCLRALLGRFHVRLNSSGISGRIIIANQSHLQ